MNNENLLISFSGGADSALMLEMALAVKYRPFCLVIDYDQLNKEELTYATTQLDAKKIPFKIFKLNLDIINSGLTGSGEQSTFNNVHSHYVPGRNTMFLSICASIAESKGIDTIWLGADYSDRENLFPDCTQEYIYKINQVFKISGSTPIRVEAPLLGLTKENILRLLTYFKVDLSTIFSGYGDFA